jgi:ribonuclease E
VAKTRKPDADEIMVVNDLPREECRIAILQEDHLEELYTERAATATNVGNIYKGRVINVESAIQAAFVDYGQGQAGFLHISDLHPRYFPGSKRTERVGRKIPRRARPPMQDALRRGDEVLVQVLKEGIGTKGPTLTSYLSIPGRLLVMMPEMDRVGVSRKVEDPERRRQMRDILDTLELPDTFGFILRTAGFGRSKTDLQRDVAYLMRLWKVMEKRIETVGAPCELYVESDLFVRTIRDILRPTIRAIVVDSDSAYRRGQALLRVVAPRSAPALIRYRKQVPIFHAFDVERQIELIHSREVPLPSGGKLVIEQTEALVAIDVNSGRSRSASDSETNAYRTNCEAVDEICRQLRLRDLGGLVINDLIDMHDGRHRRQIEDRFRGGLARDRAKSTLLRLSEFGVGELTRQRMRPSLRKSHFMPCSNCDGRGEIKTPETVGADAARQAGYLLQFDRVQRVEVACSPRVASVLLSGKRRELVRLEDTSGKRIDVRVSDAIATDRVDFYAYDERNADIDISKLPPPKPPTLAELEEAERKAAEEGPEEVKPMAAEPPEAPAATGRRRRRRRSPAPARADEMLEVEAAEMETAEAAEKAEEAAAAGTEKTGRKRRRRRRGRGGKAAAAAAASKPETEAAKAEAETEAETEAPARHDGSIRIHQLASELGVPSREVLETAKHEDGVDVKTHMSSVTNPVAEVIRRLFGRKPAAPKTVRKRPKKEETKPVVTAEETEPVSAAPEKPEPEAVKPAGSSRRRGGRRRGGRGRGGGAAKAAAATEGRQEQRAEAPSGTETVANGDTATETDRPRSPRGTKKRRRRRGGGTRAKETAEAMTNGKDKAAKEAAPETAKKPRKPAKPETPVTAEATEGESKAAAGRRRAPLYRTRRPITQGARGQGQDPDE